MIQSGTIHHSTAIAKLLVHIWQTCYSDFLPNDFLASLDIKHQTKRHQQKIESGIIYYIYLSEQKKLIGFTSFGPSRSKEFTTPMELYTLYVHPSHHNQGIGTVLLNKVLQNLPSTKNIISVEVMEENPYRNFYSKQGFKKIDSSTMELGGIEILNSIYKY